MAEAKRRGIAAGARKHQLISVAAFWQNDVPGGLGLVYNGDDVPGFNAMLRNCLKGYYANKDTDAVQVYLAQLAQWGDYCRWGNELDDGFFGLAMCNIIYLTEIGVIKNDHFNGTYYGYDIVSDLD